MPNYLLDTTIIVDCLRSKRGREKLLKKLASGDTTLGCCAVNLVEVYTGMREEEREKTTRLLESFEYYEMSKEVAKLAGEYRRDYLKEGITLSLADTLIAAVAVHYHLILITDNQKHYPLPEISFYPLPQS